MGGLSCHMRCQKSVSVCGSGPVRVCVNAPACVYITNAIKLELNVSTNTAKKLHLVNTNSLTMQNKQTYTQHIVATAIASLNV